MDMFSRFDEFLGIWDTCTESERERIRTYVVSGEMPAETNDIRAQAAAVLQFLNQKTGRAYRPTDINLQFIVGRLKEGYTVTQCRQVVARKCRDWMLNATMAEYLRPATLFNRTKFNQYVGELVERKDMNTTPKGGFLNAVS